MTIKICDAPMGAGKTSAAIKAKIKKLTIIYLYRKKQK